jgi:hypothetical protein
MVVQKCGVGLWAGHAHIVQWPFAAAASSVVYQITTKMYFSGFPTVPDKYGLAGEI